MEYTNFGSGIVLDPDGGKLYIGVLGGLMVIQDVATPTAAPTTPSASPTAIHTGLDINSTIGELVANEYTAAVLDKWIPNFSTNPQLSQAYGMTMKFIAPFKPEIFTAEVMEGIEKDLAAIK